MATPYIPPRNANFQSWLLNFSTLLTAHPTDYGLAAGDATIVADVYTAWHTAFVAGTNPATRTSVTIAAMQAARAAATATVRPYAQAIAINGGVSDALKMGIGVNPRNPTRTPIPAPTTVPTLTLRFMTVLTAALAYSDVTLPSGKAKPSGAIGMQLHATIGTAVAVDPDAARNIGTFTKSPLTISYGAGDVGKVMTVWARWITKSGPAGVAQVGPWSSSLHFTLI